MFQIRERFDELLRARDAACESCRRQSSSLDSDHRARPPPVPMPRQTKVRSIKQFLTISAIARQVTWLYRNVFWGVLGFV